MSEEEEKARSEQKVREQREADLVDNRIGELFVEPIRGNFDADHLKAIHAYIFQDLPAHQPGVVRDDTAETWIKHRALEGRVAVYDVPYLSHGVEEKITETLDQFGGADAIKGLPPAVAAERLGALYGDLDHAHGFYEGNSRTLREFTRELAEESGFKLDWTKTSVNASDRNELYVARDLAVLERAYPDLTPEKAMQTNDRAEYEASFVLSGLRSRVGDRSLTAIIRDGLSPEIQHRHERESKDLTRDMRQPALMVFDAVAGKMESLVDFVCDFLSGSSQPPPDPKTISQREQIIAQRKALAAIENIRDSMERGEGLKAEDVRNLQPIHLENIKLRGDDYVRSLVEAAQLARERERDHGRERER